MGLVATLGSLKEKVKGDPQAIRNTATALRTVANHVDTSTGKLTGYVDEVGRAWGGASADAFHTYMAAYPRAGADLKGAVTTCAGALDTAAGALERAYGTIDGLHQTAVTEENAYKQQHPDAAQDDIDSHLQGVQSLSGAVATANRAVADAEGALTTAKTAIDGQLGQHGFQFFHGIRQPGGTDFQPGDQRVDWQRTVGYQPSTRLASADDPGGPGGVQSGGGAGAPSSYGNAPAPKAQVVDWIKQAITIIKSPEMAAIMRQRGLDVSDLDPNDPTDIQRIWTIIYHESGGNPNAINNWDINAQNGVPSQGLMQTIPPTFNAHALPGYTKIREPVDNIIAGVLYTYSRYGDLAHHPGISSLDGGGPYRPY
ncbi:transglycosylase SLT domain-containing protein [Nonomuraea sp. B12E4]|uniref:transglycosylase SLT domain-containing protein n=1 Tax=Nonomuraea sp. B12E4 TaxID=3153564 RepID=UPI00325C4379